MTANLELIQNSDSEKISRERMSRFERDTVLVSDVGNLKNF